MRTRYWITTGVLLALNCGLRADFESPGIGPDFDALPGGDGARAWTFWVRGYVGYDDNVQFVPDGGVIGADQESGYFGITAEGAYRFMDNGSMDAGVAIRLDQTFHFDSSGGAVAPDQFDVMVVEPALYLNYRSDGWYGRATYSHRWEDADSAIVGVDSNNIGLMVGTELTGCLQTELSWVHEWDDFDGSGGGVTDRDGERDRVSLSLIQPGSATAPRMILRCSYLNNDADGSNFRYDGYEVMFRVESHLMDRVDGAVQVTYADLDYSTGARKEQEIFGAGVQLLYTIDQNWSADFYYNYLDVDSNASFFRGERNDVGVGLRYEF
ncbi:MAG: outer membrane beta-barrel protein [Verrucomicrobia bacterium]|nr:outer membrane beta-barrel protein [Verrucomicrobiota bacterium]